MLSYCPNRARDKERLVLDPNITFILVNIDQEWQGETVRQTEKQQCENRPKRVRTTRKRKLKRK